MLFDIRALPLKLHVGRAVLERGARLSTEDLNNLLAWSQPLLHGSFIISGKLGETFRRSYRPICTLMSSQWHFRAWRTSAGWTVHVITPISFVVRS